MVSASETVNLSRSGSENPPVRKWQQATSSLDSKPYFEANQGQYDKRVRYVARGTQGYSSFLIANGAVFVLSAPKSEGKNHSMHDDFEDVKSGTQDESHAGVAVFMRLVNGNQSATREGVGELAHRTNYFIGNDESKWRTGISNYSQVRMDGIYDGIDTIWHGLPDGSLQYNFEIKPNANLRQVAWEIEGAEDAELTGSGDLLIKTQFGEIREKMPLIYQNNAVLNGTASRFVLKKNRARGIITIGFEVGGPAHSSDFLTNRVETSNGLSFSTFLGGNDTDDGNGIAVDSSGNTYVAGYTRSIAFPTTPGAFDTTQNSNFDVFVSKLNPTGTALLYSTFIGGNANDECYGIAVDPSGNAYLTGLTGSAAYPTTAGAFDRAYNNGDAFVTKINESGTQLVYSTFIGGGGGETGYGVALDSSGNAYVVGSTTSTDYPTTAASIDTTYNGGNFDAFVSKLDPQGANLLYSTFIGGNALDQGRDVAVDSSGDAYITGYTLSTSGFPITGGAFDTSFNGNNDSFVCKLNSSGTAFVYSTFLGGSGSDQGYGIAVDSTENVYVTGTTDSSNFPTTAGAFDTTVNGLAEDAFVCKLDSSGNHLAYSTYIGGNDMDEGKGIALDSSGNAFITGWTFSTNYPTTSSAFDATQNGNSDVLVSELNATGTQLLYSTFIGGSNPEEGRRIALDHSGNPSIIGPTTSANYPTTAGAIDGTFNGESDVLVSKLNLNGPLVPIKSRADFDGDGKTDLSVYRPSDSNWYVFNSGGGGAIVRNWGIGGDVLTPGDYDGDGKADTAAYRPSTGQWLIFRSSDSTVNILNFGITGDRPVAGDYDGDGKTDIAQFRPSQGVWYVFRSSDNGVSITTWGEATDLTVPADYDGDGKTDVAVFRPSTGVWYVFRSTAGPMVVGWGVVGDKPVEADYDGDGKDDVAVYRPSEGNWYVFRSSDNTPLIVNWGNSTDVPSPGDYDGDGKDDFAVFRDGTWFAYESTAGPVVSSWGAAGDTSIPSKYIP